MSTTATRTTPEKPYSDVYTERHAVCGMMANYLHDKYPVHTIPSPRTHTDSTVHTIKGYDGHCTFSACTNTQIVQVLSTVPLSHITVTIGGNYITRIPMHGLKYDKWAYDIVFPITLLKNTHVYHVDFVPDPDVEDSTYRFECALKVVCDDPAYDPSPPVHDLLAVDKLHITPPQQQETETATQKARKGKAEQSLILQASPAAKPDTRSVGEGTTSLGIQKFALPSTGVLFHSRTETPLDCITHIDLVWYGKMYPLPLFRLDARTMYASFNGDPYPLLEKETSTHRTLNLSRSDRGVAIQVRSSKEVEVDMSMMSFNVLRSCPSELGHGEYASVIYWAGILFQYY